MELDELLEVLDVPTENNMGAFFVPSSPEAEAENDDVQVQTSPSSAPATVTKEAAQVRGGQQSELKLPNLLKSSTEELEKLARMDEAHVANIVTQPSAIELIKMVLVKKKCDEKRALEIVQLQQVVKAREEKNAELRTLVNANKIRENHAAQNKHLEPTAVQLRVRPARIHACAALA